MPLVSSPWVVRFYPGVLEQIQKRLLSNRTPLNVRQTVLVSWTRLGRVFRTSPRMISWPFDIRAIVFEILGSAGASSSRWSCPLEHLATRQRTFRRLHLESILWIPIAHLRSCLSQCGAIVLQRSLSDRRGQRFARCSQWSLESRAIAFRVIQSRSCWHLWNRWSTCRRNNRRSRTLTCWYRRSAEYRAQAFCSQRIRDFTGRRNTMNSRAGMSTPVESISTVTTTFGFGRLRNSRMRWSGPSTFGLPVIFWTKSSPWPKISWQTRTSWSAWDVWGISLTAKIKIFGKRPVSSSCA